MKVVGSWTGIAILAMAIFAASTEAQTIYETDFNPVTGSWFADAPQGGVGWSIDSTPSSYSPSNTLNYNDGTDYEKAGGGSVNGSAYSPLHDISGSANPQLSFWCNFKTETERFGQQNNFDIRKILIKKQSGTQVKSVKFNNPAGIGGSGTGTDQQCDSSGFWHEHIILGDTGDIRNDARYAFEHAAPGGGYIMGSTHSLAVDARPENILEMKRCRDEWGIYPIDPKQFV